MKIKTTTLTIFFMISTYLGFAQTPDANGILYVKKGSAGNGSAWNNAIGELADALKAAKSNTAIQQIWVAAGTYKPLYSPANNNFGNAAGRENTFLLVKDVKLYGGFSGSETTLSQRNLSITANQSILSGDISDNDIVVGSGASLYIGNNTDNTYHVVISAGGVGTAELNGFTVKGGNANGGSSLNVNGEQILANYGGGMHNNNSSPTLTNVNIIGNSAFDYGGGMCNINNSSPTLINVRINSNITRYGGGMYNWNSSPTLTNVSINGNNISYNGGGMHNDNSSPILTNVNINGNSSHLGGGMYNRNSSPVLTNVNIIGNSNSTVFISGAMVNESSSPKINNSIIWGNTRNIYNQNSTPTYQYSLVQGSGGSVAWVPAFGTDGGNNIDASPFFTDADGADNILGTADDDYTLKPISPAINGGSNSLYNTNGRNLANDKDLAGNPRVYNSSGNGEIDMGAYEYQGNAVSILYVNQNVTGGDDTGTSWTNALKELANALLIAKANKNIKQIWVAKGTYKPMYSAETGANFGTNQGRDNSFLLVVGVKVYGGFAGTETTLAQRDLSITANSTVLSGDFNNDDIITGKGQSLSITNNGENAYHVVISADNSTGAVLDGFTITGGNANTNATFTVSGQTVYRTAGGGIAVHGASPNLNNLKVYGNSANISGGGIYLYDASLSLNQVYVGQNKGGGMGISFGAPSLTKVVLEGNNALYGGGINIGADSSPILEDVSLLANYASGNGGGVQIAGSGTIVFNRVNFVQNETAGFGGAAFISYSSPKFVNVAFTGNSAQKGGALYAIGTPSAPQFTNCTFKANQATGGQALYAWETAAITLNNCIVWKDASFTGNNNLEENNSSFILKNTMLQYPGNGFNITLDMASTALLNKDPLFGNGADNIAGTNDDDLNLKPGSLAIGAGDNVLYENADGNSANNSLSQDKDLAGNPRLTGSNIDLGAFEAPAALPVTLLSFQIKKDNNAAVLTWETASEKDNAGFEILRTTNDQNFVSIATVVGKGTTDAKNSYTWYDRKPLNGTNYYKLVQRDKDGKTEELGIRTLNFSLNHEDILLYPNPVIEKANVLFAAGRYKNITLSDISGRTLQRLQITPTETEKVIAMDSIPKGTYLLKLQGDTQKSIVKIIKN